LIEFSLAATTQSWAESVKPWARYAVEDVEDGREMREEGREREA
jgi:hypothetical protein